MDHSNLEVVTLNTDNLYNSRRLLTQVPHKICLENSSVLENSGRPPRTYVGRLHTTYVVLWVPRYGSSRGVYSTTEYVSPLPPYARVFFLVWQRSLIGKTRRAYCTPFQLSQNARCNMSIVRRLLITSPPPPSRTPGAATNGRGQPQPACSPSRVLQNAGSMLWSIDRADFRPPPPPRHTREPLTLCNRASAENSRTCSCCTSAAPRSRGPSGGGGAPYPRRRGCTSGSSFFR